MLNVGGLLLMLGVCQTIFQAYLLLENGYWPSFSIRQMVAEFNMGIGYLPVPQLERLIDWLLSFEFSFTLIAVGLLLMLRGPLAQLFDAYQAARSMMGMRRRNCRPPFTDPIVPAADEPCPAARPETGKLLARERQA